VGVVTQAVDVDGHAELPDLRELFETAAEMALSEFNKRLASPPRESSESARRCRSMQQR
jgi:hypothetical protein